jgi:UDP-N-acetylglucosamine:LPS N-acetylglucosamine transferase
MTKNKSMRRTQKKLQICLTCSHGGHLNEMLQLLEAFDGHDVFYFCYDAETTRVLHNARLVPNMARNPVEFLKNLFRAASLFHERRPDLIVSTGAEIAIPVMLVGLLFGARTIYVECGAQVAHPSVTGRVLHHFVDAFFVQWPELLSAYRGRARYAGSLIDETPPESCTEDVK